MNSEERPLIAEIRRTSTLIKCYIGKEFGKEFSGELTGAECMTLTHIMHRDPEKVVASELVKRFGVSKATVSQIIGSLKRKGYVRQRFSKRDHRVRMIYLTEKGEELKVRFDELFTEVNESLTKGFSDEEKIVLRAFLKRLQENVGGNDEKECCL